jgi:hypothetical protein
MKTIKDILIPEEISKYDEEWKNFNDKYHLNTPYNTHSGKPVISEVYHFGDKPLFRAHVMRDDVKKKLRSIDPYFISRYHLNPFWHISHYLTVLEQMYHASMHLVRDNYKYHVKDIPQEFKLHEPIYWHSNISLELITQSIRESKNYKIEDCLFTLYDDNENKIKARLSARTFVQLREYAKFIEEIKEGKTEALEGLIKKIESQDKNHKRLIKPRTNLPTKEYLISELKSGRIPETELHNFFSFWDKK